MDRGVIATAFELFAARHYPGVVAVCTDALEEEPECVPLLLLRARANVALRRDLDAQADLRDVIRLDPRSVLAYRLLGELAARCDENESAAQYFREALRLDPDDREARDWLQVVDAPVAAPVPGSATGHRFPCVPHSAIPRPAEPGEE
ncbi:MAG TPA: tetratricopeptide repeat protein [Kofleriaceae bacterium]|nr:tetratricopeptide repeat protein [Kofleriaceae bacterium]